MSDCRTRREFLHSAATGAAVFGGVLPLCSRSSSAQGNTGKVKVALVKSDKAVTNRNVVDQKQAALMIESALRSLTGKQMPAEAWKALGFTKSDVVGIKVNCNTWTFLLHTHPELVYALCDSLSTVVPPNNLIIYERYTGELERSGYRINKGNQGIRCFGNDEGGGFREGVTRIVTDLCTKIINVPSLKGVDGEFSGSLCLKNHIGSIPLVEMTECHGNADFCTEVCLRAPLKAKSVLALCDGLRGTWRRGTPWYWGGILMSRDPIALECAALDVMNEKRLAENAGAFGIPEYVKRAGKVGLGVADPGKIDVMKTVV